MTDRPNFKALLEGISWVSRDAGRQALAQTIANIIDEHFDSDAFITKAHAKGLKKLRKALRADLGWQQGDWTTDDPQRHHWCKTGACLAGHIDIEAGWEPTFTGHAGSTIVKRDANGAVIETGEARAVAMDILNFTPYVNSSIVGEIFSGHNTVDDIVETATVMLEHAHGSSTNRVLIDELRKRIETLEDRNVTRLNYIRDLSTRMAKARHILAELGGTE